MGATKYIIGIFVALFGHSISAMGINLQKYAHLKPSDKPLGKQPVWILGLVCMALCEVVNFVALSLVPASVVAPLGSFSVVCCAIFGSLLFKESIDKQAIIGIAFIVFGTIIVVWNGPSNSEEITVEAFVKIIHSLKAKIYIACDLLILFILYRCGDKSIFGTIGLAAVSAGNTVTLTKALSTFVAISVGGNNQLLNPVPYIVILLIACSLVMQVNKLNKGMEMFPSYICSALQFVILTTVTNFNSAVLYGEMKSLTSIKATLFIIGCLIVMFGVYKLSYETKPRPQGDESTLLENHQSI